MLIFNKSKKYFMKGWLTDTGLDSSQGQGGHIITWLNSSLFPVFLWYSDRGYVVRGTRGRFLDIIKSPWNFAKQNKFKVVSHKKIRINLYLISIFHFVSLYRYIKDTVTLVNSGSDIIPRYDEMLRKTNWC